ncbi:MAG: AtpZ/AtpI family protein [Stigonema ocellatum SAG 48.90 = DSM 106950]|nr:AtpZ/AtpI family protein [Stigonema ocellatum SAG 48.90 = DSM 106950]
MKTPGRKSRAQTHLFAKAIANKERRKLYARQAKPYGGVWFGFGFAGLVGWSVVAPTLLGMGLGIWIDFQFPSRFSWTLALMLAGLTLGCLIAWEWVSQEQERMARDQPPDDSPQFPADSPNEKEGT